MGNQMLQYMFALNLRRLVKDDLNIFGYDIPNWSMRNIQEPKQGNRRLRLSGHFVDIKQIAKFINAGIVKHVQLNGLAFRLANYAPPSFYNEVFNAAGVETLTFGAGQVVINIRGAEILRNVHPDYGPVPFRYIDAVLDNTDSSPVFLGQIGDDVYSTRLRQRYAHAEFHPSQGPIKDFETLRRANEISVSVSTFSWLAAWLSSAKTIHYPLSGILNPAQRPDIDLTPIGNARYKFYKFEPKRWTASEQDFENLWSSGEYPVLNNQQMAELMKTTRDATKKAWMAKKVKTAMRAYFAGAVNRLACG